MTRTHIAPLALLILCLTPALASVATPAAPADAKAAAAPDETPSWAKPYLGAWTLNADGEGGTVCGVKFVRGMSIGGAAMELSPACQQNFPLEDVAGWTLAGKRLQFIDALRKPVISFTQGPDKDWSASVDGQGLILSRGAADPFKSMRDLVGEGTFVLSGPNHRDPCGFYLEAKTSFSGTLEQSGRCAALWKGKAWAHWSYAGKTLTFSDTRGAALLVLNRADPTTFIAEFKPGPIYFGPGGIDGSCQITKDC